MLTTLLCFLACFSPLASTADTFGPYTYIVTDGQATITSFDKSYSGAVTVTNMLGGYSVTAIGDWAFYNCTGLSSVTIPAGVLSIGSFAFRGCTGLTSVTIPASVTQITESLFHGCTSLTKVTIPDGVTTISNNAFTRCTSLNGVTIPDSVTIIGHDAFLYCTALTNISIPSSVTSIGGNAFYGCTGLTSVRIPASVTAIDESAFSGCASLKTISVDPANRVYSSVEGVLFSKDQTKLILFPRGKTGSCLIPASLTTLPRITFSGCASLEAIIVDSANVTFSSVDGVLFDKDQTTLITCPAGKAGSCVIPASVTKVGAAAFSGCSRLMAINVDAANTNYSSLDGVLFNKAQTTLIQCPGGKTGHYAIPGSVTNIGDGARIGNIAFDRCAGLTSITIPEGVTGILGYAFRGCTGLTSITLPSSLTSIRHWAFDSCTRLTDIIIPASVTKVAASAFTACSRLMAINVDAANTNYSSLDGVFFNKAQTTLIRCPEGKEGTCTIPASVTNIAPSAFSSVTSLAGTGIAGSQWFGCAGLLAVTVDAANTNYTSLDGVLFSKDRTRLILFPPGKTGSYAIPAGVSSIESYAFMGCTGLTSVTIPDGVTEIGNSAFRGCMRLTNVVVPASVTSYGDSAFRGCTNLPYAIQNLGPK